MNSLVQMQHRTDVVLMFVVKVNYATG